MDKKSILEYLQSRYSYFHERFGVKRIGLFGSYARDEATEDSDIDIFVDMKPSLFDMVEIKEQMEKDLNKKIDIVREHKNLKPFFLKMIKKDLIYV